MIDYLIGIGVVLICVFIIIRLIRNRKKGKSGGCGCTSCSVKSTCKATLSKKD